MWFFKVRHKTLFDVLFAKKLKHFLGIKNFSEKNNVYIAAIHGLYKDYLLTIEGLRYNRSLD
jgi:hypothetical protein